MILQNHLWNSKYFLTKFTILMRKVLIYCPNLCTEKSSQVRKVRTLKVRELRTHGIKFGSREQFGSLEALLLFLF